MEQFQRHCSSGESVEIEILDVIPSHPLDEYREVRLRLPKGPCYRAGFWRDPMKRGGHWWEEPGMVIVQDLTTDHVMSAVEEILQRGAIDDAFESELDS